MEHDERVRDVRDYEVVSSSCGDALLSFVGRTILPEIVEGELDGNTVIIPQTENNQALRFLDLQERQTEILRDAGIIYLVRVLGENITYSVLKLSQDNPA